jgi:hypothetical protein
VATGGDRRRILGGSAAAWAPASRPRTAPYQLPRPNVTIEAEPPPSFTYWAPEGAVVKNHPHAPGIWLAFLNGRNVASYYRDECHACEYQRFVGTPLSALPIMPEGVTLRASGVGCAVNSDLRRDRMNVQFDADLTITQIVCY